MKGSSKGGKAKNHGLYSPMLGASAPSGRQANDVSAAEKAKSKLSLAKAASCGEPVAVLALSESGEILAAREACSAIFGRDPAALVGQNICLLLKDGFDNDVGRFLHRHRSGKNPAGTTEMRVLALRKDGSEFLAQVTTLTWQWDTAITKKADVSRLCWTAAFRGLGAPPTPPPHLSSDDARVDRRSGVAMTKVTTEEVTTSPIEESASTRPPDTAAVEAPPSSEPAKMVELPQPPAVSPPAPVDVPKPVAEVPREDSTTFRTAAQLAALDLKRQIEDLETQLKSATAEIEATKVESEQRGLRESELRAQLEAAKEATGFVEAALREETARKQKAEERLQNLSSSLREEQAERSKRFEAELISLRQERDELNAKLSAEQEAVGESTCRARELELRLSRNAAEFQRTRGELERQAAERQREESVWREQLDTAWIAKREIEGAWAGAVEQNKKIEEELAKLREEHDELQARLEAEQKAASESQERAKQVQGRLSRNAADSERARSALDKQAVERELADARWREKLETAESAKVRIADSLTEVTDRCRQLEADLAALKAERDQLNARLAAEQKAVAAANEQIKNDDRSSGCDDSRLDDLREKLELALAEAERVRTETGEQLSAAKSRSTALERDLAEATAGSQRLEQEATALRRDNDELVATLAAERKSTAAAMERAQEIESRLDSSCADVERLREELERQNLDHQDAATRFAKQLEASCAQQEKLESALADADEQRRKGLEELAALRRERDEIMTRSVAEKHSADNALRRASEAQRRVDQNVEEVERLTAEVHELRDERDRLESRWLEQEQTAKTQIRKIEADWAAAVERNVRSEEALVELRRRHDETLLQVRSGQQALSESACAMQELERRLELGADELKRTNGKFERLRTDRQIAEASWRDQLEAAKALANKLDSAWAAATERSRRSELELASVQREREDLVAKLTASERQTAEARKRLEVLESQVNRMAAELERFKGGPEPFANSCGHHDSEFREELAGRRAGKTETEDLLSGPAERNRRSEAELSMLNSTRNRPSKDHRQTGSGETAVETGSSSKPLPTPAEPGVTSAARSDLGQSAPLQPGTVQQYHFEKPKPTVRRVDARPAKKKLQP